MFTYNVWWRLLSVSLECVLVCVFGSSLGDSRLGGNLLRGETFSPT